MKKNKNFWFGKRVLVTGGDGFTASHLIRELLKMDAAVVTTIRHNRPIKTLDLLNGYHDERQPDIEYCNLLTYQELRRICDRHQIDTIFHLAATTIVSDAANSPMSTVENNVIPTLNILEVARIKAIPRVIIASTDKVYGDHSSGESETLPYKENYALRGLDVYSSSKVCVDMIAQTFAYQFKMPIVVTRSCNVYGPGDLNFTRLIPRTIMSLIAKKPPVINLGNENVLREYAYIEDQVRAYLLIAEKMDKYYGSENSNMPKDGNSAYGWASFNLGSYKESEIKDISKCDKIKSVKDVITLLRKKINDIGPKTIKKPANFIEIPDQYLDSTKLRELGFEPSISFEQGINESIKWYKDNYEVLEKIAHTYIK